MSNDPETTTAGGPRAAAGSAAYDEPQEWTPERIRREFERALHGIPPEGTDPRDALAPN